MGSCCCSAPSIPASSPSCICCIAVAVESSQVSNLPSAVPDILLRLVFPVPSLLVVVAVAVVAAVVVAGSWYCCGAGKAGA